MSIPYSRSRGQGQGRYTVRCEKIRDPVFPKYSSCNVETLHVGSVRWEVVAHPVLKVEDQRQSGYMVKCEKLLMPLSQEVQ